MVEGRLEGGNRVEGNGSGVLAVRDAAAAAGGSLADLLDRVVWDYSPRDTEASPLLSTARFFEDFPWDGEPDGDPGEVES